MKKKVLIFDDDQDILDLCTILLTRKGYDVVTRNDCRNVLKTVASVKPDVVVMDNKIPEHGGIFATRLIKSHDDLKSIPVIFFTANTNIEKLSQEAMADCYLKKPFNIHELENMVRRFSSDQNLENQAV